ncbi:hypothetical protein CJF30_00008764 [Rutstroemia sp. NJR-2017a BBW]|nr:hypothetical protein CJF30_00008764 [Rutstroemia sp. NJR-2017a BBW]
MISCLGASSTKTQIYPASPYMNTGKASHSSRRSLHCSKGRSEKISSSVSLTLLPFQIVSCIKPAATLKSTISSSPSQKDITPRWARTV